MPSDASGGGVEAGSSPLIRRSSFKVAWRTPKQKVCSVFKSTQITIRDERQHHQGLFGAILAGDLAQVLDLVEHNCTCLEQVDAVGATPVHFAFLRRKTNIGKELVLRYPHCATYTYGQGPYLGENILHIAIMQQNVDLVRWLLGANPALLNAEVVGKFFAPAGMVYFGGYPLLFAVSSNQREVLQTILNTRARDSEEELKNHITVVDRYGNTALHMTVIHDLPDMYDLVLEVAEKLEEPDCEYDDDTIAFRRWANHQRLTPLALAAAMGKVRMFQHILQKETVTIWEYGPVICHMVPLSGLEQPVTQSFSGRSSEKFCVVQRTALECICSDAPLTNCLKTKGGRVPHEALQARRELVMNDVIQVVLERKWQTFAQRKFYSEFALTLTAQLLWIISTFIPNHYANGGNRSDHSVEFGLTVACEALVVVCLVFKVIRSSRGAVFQRTVLMHSAQGLIAFKNWVLRGFCVLYITAWALRLAFVTEAGAVCASFAALVGWLHVFFFLLGFRATGPFVITIKEMIQFDMKRFFGVFSVVTFAYVAALYLLSNDGFGVDVFFRYMVELILFGIGGIWPVSNYTEAGGYNYWIVSVFLISWLIFVMVLLLNTVIAMMNNTYSEVEANSERRWCVEWANIIASYETEYGLEKMQEFRRAFGIPLKREHPTSPTLTKLYLEVSIFNKDWKNKEQDNNRGKTRDKPDATSSVRSQVTNAEIDAYQSDSDACKCETPNLQTQAQIRRDD